MKAKMYYGNGVLCLPEAVLSHMSEVNGDALKVLLRLAAGDDISQEALAAELDITPKKVAKAIDFWQQAGVLATDKKIASNTKKVSTAVSPTAPPKSSPRVEDSAASVPVHTKSQTIPHYTTEELTALLEKRSEWAALIDECSRVFGKVFSTHEVGLLLGIMEYLGVEGEYLLLLLAHCAKLGKKSVRYVETVALSLYDEGITEPSALQECLRRREQLVESEGKIRQLFGLNSRALTTKEQRMINTWLFTYHYDLDVITHAYEVTVDATGNPSIPYANSILDRWAAADLHTLSDIEKADAERTARSKSPTTPGNSFDTDDFFDAALRRSFGDDFKASKK